VIKKEKVAKIRIKATFQQTYVRQIVLFDISVRTTINYTPRFTRIFHDCWPHVFRLSSAYYCLCSRIFLEGLTIGSNDVIPVSTVRDLGIYFDSYISMRTQIAKTVSSCFAAAQQIQSIKRSVSRPVLQSLVMSMVLTRLDCGSGTLAGLPRHLMDRLQLVINAAARLVFSARKYDHITPLLREFHWLSYPDQISYRLAVLAF